MIVGTAEILAVPVTTGFESELRKQTSIAFGSVSKDAEKAGEDAGKKLEQGVGKGSSGLGKILEALPLGKLSTGLGAVESKGGDAGAALGKLGGIASLGASAGLAAVAAASVDLASKYESATAKIAANADISTAAAKKIGDAFLGTAGKTIYSAQTIAASYAGVAGQLGAVQGRALSAGQASNVMAAAMDLAEASGTKLEGATAALAGVLQAYHQKVEQSVKDTNILFTTSRLTGVGIETLGASLDRMKAKLGNLAPSLGESAALLATLAKNGVTGRAAMTALSSGFTTLVGGSKGTSEAAKELGIQIFNAQGKFVGMKSIIEQLRPKLSEYTEQSQLQATKALFGASANKQLLSVILQGPQAYQQETQAVSKSGAAKEAAAKQSKTFSHELDLLKSTAVDLAIKLGEVLVPIVQKVVEGLKIAVEGVVSLATHWKVAWEDMLSITEKVVNALIVPINAIIKTIDNLSLGLVKISEIENLHLGGGSLAAAQRKAEKGETQPLLGSSTSSAAERAVSRASLGGSQTGIAQTIRQVGEKMGASSKEILAAEEAASVESKYANLTYGDRDSKGVFQQRASQGWGTVAEEENPALAAAMFYRSAKGVSSGGLLAGQLAQAVQKSGYPKRYDESQGTAEAVLRSIGASTGGQAQATSGSKTFATPEVTKAAEKAAKEASSAATKVAKEQAEKVVKEAEKGESLKTKMLEAISSKSLTQLNAALNLDHKEGLSKLEKELSSDHSSALSKLADKLASIHKQTMEAAAKLMAKATAEALEKKQVSELGVQAREAADRASGMAAQIADATQVTLDRQAEGGLSGAALVAAQAQTALDVLKQGTDAWVNQAKLEEDHLAGGSELERARAAAALAGIEASGKVREAEAQSTLDLAKASSESAAKAASAAEATKTAAQATATAVTAALASPQFDLTFYGANMSAADVMGEIGWAIKTGALPAAVAA